MERKNVYIFILALSTIIVSCIAIYLVVNGNNETKILEDKIANLYNENIISNNTEIIDNNMKSTNETKTYNIMDISNNLSSDMYLSKELGNVKTKILDGKLYVAFTTDEIGTAKYEKELNKYYEVSNINGKVIDVSIVKIPTSGYPIFVMLMNDGTLLKTKFVEGSDIVCDGKIEGYENIVRIDDVEVVNKVSFGDEVSNHYSNAIVATDKYGNTKLVKNIY